MIKQSKEKNDSFGEETLSEVENTFVKADGKSMLNDREAVINCM